MVQVWCIMDVGRNQVKQRKKNAATVVRDISHPPSRAWATGLVHEGMRQSTVHINVSQEMINVTEDKMRLHLDYFLRIEKKSREWYTPAGMLLTETAASVTPTFHGALGVSGEQWHAIFQVLTILTVIWLICALTRVRRGPSVDSLIESLKHRRQPEGSIPEEASRA